MERHSRIIIGLVTIIGSVGDKLNKKFENSATFL